MNIVMFTDAYWPRVNGVTVSVDSFSRALEKAGHKVLIICSSYPEENPQAPGSADPLPQVPDDQTTDLAENLKTGDNLKAGEGPRIVRVPSMPALITKEDRIAKINKWFWVFRQVELFNPHVIHINTEMVIAEFGFLYALIHNLPAIYTFHTMWEDYGPNYFPMFPSKMVKLVVRGVLKNILTRSYRVIVPTPQIEEVVHRYKPRAKTFLLPTGIEMELFEHSEEESSLFRKKFEERYPVLKEKRILLFAGRVAREKNIDFLIKLLPAILAKHPDVVLLVVGNGPDLEFFRDEAKKYKVEANCVFTGYMERKDLALTYTIAEVFVFPSLTETQGLVTVEAMLSGTPVVAIGALGTLLVMGGDNGGFMVKNDEAEFTARVLDLLEDSELRYKKSMEAKNHARAWSIEELTKKLETIYESTVKTFREEHGISRTPVWELVMDKRWWRVTNKIFQKKITQRWQEMLSRLQR